MSSPTGSGLAQRGLGRGRRNRIFVDAASNWETESLPNFNGSALVSFGSGGSTARVNRAISLYGSPSTAAGISRSRTAAVLSRSPQGGVTAATPSAATRTYALEADVTFG